MLGAPFDPSVMCPTGPSLYFFSMASLAMSFMSLQYGTTYPPGAGLPARIASRTASSLAKP